MKCSHSWRDPPDLLQLANTASQSAIRTPSWGIRVVRRRAFSFNTPNNGIAHTSARMVKLARRRAMPHRHVPEPKEPSPFFERLRSELKFKARHRVAEAVDAVCAAFEDELTQLTKPLLPMDYSYELFYDCCSRLARFIDSNLSTTPGFLVEMDRLIFACHSGDSGDDGLGDPTGTGE